MPTNIFFIVSLVLAIVIVYVGSLLLPYAGVNLSTGFAIGLPLIITPLMMVVLTPLNRRLIEYRRAHGFPLENVENGGNDKGWFGYSPTDDD